MSLRCKKGQLAMITGSYHNNGKVVTCLELSSIEDRYHVDFGQPAWIVDVELESRWPYNGEIYRLTRLIADFRLTPINDPDLDVCIEETEDIQKENQHA